MEPYLIDFPKIGESGLGYISVAEHGNLPFPVRRIYWTYYTPENITRGYHSHYELQQILVAVAGKITVKTESENGVVKEFILDKPNVGLYIPKRLWRNMSYSHNAVQMCIASLEYDEKDYIRDYHQFVKTP